MNNNIIDYNKYISLFTEKKVITVLKFYILSQEAKVKSVWAPVLTPYIGKERVSDFCVEFNKESLLYYNKNVIVPVFLLLYKNKSYHIVFKAPTYFFILKFIFDLDKLFYLKKRKFYYITLEELWYILFIKYCSFMLLSERSFLCNFLKLLKKFGIFIIV